MKENFDKSRWEILITIIISCTSIFIAIKANDISKMQSLIAKNSALPTIEVHEKISSEESLLGNESSIIEVFNLSGKMSNYQSKAITFLECEYVNPKSFVYESCSVPIFSYYFTSVKTGSLQGLIEFKDSVGNYSTLKKLNDEVFAFNKQNDNQEIINVKLQTYLRIRYWDLLDQEQIRYYKTNRWQTELIKPELGKYQFDQYNYLIDNGYGINPNVDENITVDMLKDNIAQISKLRDNICLETEMNIKGGKDMEVFTNSLLSNLVGAFCALLGGVGVYMFEKKNRESHAASVLYYDLKSIEYYLFQEKNPANIRYSSDWQNIVANCSFLKSDDIQRLYKIYDVVYNYNYNYMLKEKGGTPFVKYDLEQHIELQGLLLDIQKSNCDIDDYNQEYENLLKHLKKYIKA